ncbi:MAG: V-type ATPase subunit [Planctomycetota bacterium]|nr:V-type ATPase subunit [Planctomycetota bacterium]
MPTSLESIRPVRRPAAWTFVSGKVATLESELLPRSFFSSVLAADDRAGARAALGKAVYRPFFPDDNSLSSASSILDARLKEVRAEIFRLSPPHLLENYFGIAERFRSFRTLFNRLSKQTNPSLGDLEELFPLFAGGAELADSLGEHRRMLGRKTSPQAVSPMERSLYLDSAACTLMLAVAKRMPERLARAYMSDRAILTAWGGILRVRHNGASEEMVRNWYVLGSGGEFAQSVLAAENDPRSAVYRRLSTTTAAALERADAARLKADVDAVAVDSLHDIVLACRQVPFGAERALSYLVAIEVELVNLELSLGAVVNAIDRPTTILRLRREYA